MKNFLIATFFVFTFILSGTLCADEKINPKEKFAEANQFYEKGDFENAQSIYENLVSQGYQAASLYYNLGNLSYKKGERGKAILWYERALRLSPRDADIQFNLSLARSHIKDEKPSLAEKLILWWNTTELGWAFTLFVWIFFALFGAKTLGWIQGELWPTMTLWATGFLLIGSGLWFGANIMENRKPTAILVSPPGEVRNGPGTDYAVGFTIPEGSKVLVLNIRPEWTQVGVPAQGLKGWMPSKEVEMIIENPVWSD